MKAMKYTVAMLVAAFMFLGGVVADAKEAPPEPGKMKKLSFPKFKEFDLKNDLEVVVVEHHEQPIASIWLAIRSGSTLDPEGKSSLAQFVGSMLNKGTDTHDSDELAEWIESKGGSFNVSVDNDYTIITVSILSEYLDTAYQFVSEVVMTATFPEEELEKERKRVKTALEFQLADPRAMANRHFNSVVYGHHPYAVQPVVETVEAVMRDDVVAYHARNYVANNAIMFVVGDVKHKEVKKAAEKYFGDWEAGTPDQVMFPEPPERTAKNIALYHRPGSVQTNVYVGHLGLRADDEDWPSVTVANRILGGGATGRLFMNLREEKGWTYGAYSTFTQNVDVGCFRATASVRTAVTDSALTELLVELDRMVDEPVSDDDLEYAKSYLIGNFPTTIETPSQIAAQIGQVKLLGRDKKYLESYRKDIAKVTVADVQAAMQTHLHPDQMAIVLVGDATEVMDMVEPIASVALYDIEGNPISLDELAILGTDFEFDTSSLKNMKSTYSVKMQEMNLGDMESSLEKKSDTEFVTKSSVSGMFTMAEDASFGGKFEPLAYSFSMTAMGQERSATFEFADGKATGKIEGGEDGPKDVSLELVKGTLLSSVIEFVIATLPLGEVKEYKFPALDPQSGDMQNVKIEVLGEEDMMVPAGSFATYKVRVKRPDGETILYVLKDLPHYVIRQEIPAQRLTIELKSMEM